MKVLKPTPDIIASLTDKNACKISHKKFKPIPHGGGGVNFIPRPKEKAEYEEKIGGLSVRDRGLKKKISKKQQLKNGIGENNCAQNAWKQDKFLPPFYNLWTTLLPLDIEPNLIISLKKTRSYKIP